MSKYENQLDQIRQGNIQSALIDNATGKFIEYQNYPKSMKVETIRGEALEGHSYVDISKENFANLMVDKTKWKWENDTFTANTDPNFYNGGE